MVYCIYTTDLSASTGKGAGVKFRNHKQYECAASSSSSFSMHVYIHVDYQYEHPWNIMAWLMDRWGTWSPIAFLPSFIVQAKQSTWSLNGRSKRAPFTCSACQVCSGGLYSRTMLSLNTHSSQVVGFFLVTAVHTEPRARSTPGLSASKTTAAFAVVDQKLCLSWNKIKFSSTIFVYL